LPLLAGPVKEFGSPGPEPQMAMPPQCFKALR